MILSAGMFLCLLYLGYHTYDQLILSMLFSLLTCSICGYYDSYLMQFWFQLLTHDRFDIGRFSRYGMIIGFTLIIIYSLTLIPIYIFWDKDPIYVGIGNCDPCTWNTFLMDTLPKFTESCHFIIIIC